MDAAHRARRELEKVMKAFHVNLAGHYANPRTTWVDDNATAADAMREAEKQANMPIYVGRTAEERAAEGTTFYAKDGSLHRRVPFVATDATPMREVWSSGGYVLVPA